MNMLLAADKRWILCLFGFISVTVDHHACKDNHIFLEASENQVSSICFLSFWCGKTEHSQFNSGLLMLSMFHPKL